MSARKGTFRMIVTAALVACALAVAVPGYAVQVTLLTHEFNALSPVVDYINEKFKAEGRDIEILLISGKLEDIIVQTAGGTPPDIVEIDLIHGPSLAAQGLMYQLDALIERDGLSGFVDGFIPAMMTLSRYEGKTYFLPLWADNSMLYYSITKLEAAGLPGVAPATWDELIEAARKTTFPERDMYGYERMPGLFWFTFMPYLWANGGDVLSPDGTQVVINSKAAEEAIQLWHDMANVYQVTRPSTHSSREKFRDGLDTFFVQGGDKVGSIRNFDPDLKWDVSPIPVRVEGQQPSSFIGGGTFGIMAGSRNVEAAWEVMKVFLSEEIQVNLVPEEMGTPVHRDFLNNPYFREEPVHLKFAQAAFLPNARTPYTTAFASLGTIIEPFNQAVLGQISIKEALERMEHAALVAIGAL